MFYVREVAGWALMVLGLWLFYQSYSLLMNRMIIQSGPTVLMGIVVFRGGIHLLKVAVAARVCQQAPVEARPTARAAATGPPPAAGDRGPGRRHSRPGTSRRPRPRRPSRPPHRRTQQGPSSRLT